MGLAGVLQGREEEGGEGGREGERERERERRRREGGGTKKVK